MNPRTSGLFAFKHNRLITSNELRPTIFGEFHVWVLERWKFAPGDTSSGPTDYVNSGFITEAELEDFLLRKAYSKFELHIQPTGPRFEGRLRLLFSVKKNGAAPSLAMGQSDFEKVERELNLHLSTAQYFRRSMKASRFWGPDKSNFDLLLAFPPFPALKFSCISLNYDLESKFTNALIAEQAEVHDGAEYFKRMLDSCPTLWPHPLLVPILLLDMLMDSLEVGILVNIKSIKKVEAEVSRLPSLDMDTRPLAERVNVTELLTRLHATLKDAIKLLDATNWVDKTAIMLNGIGNELNEMPKFGSNHLWVEMQSFLEGIRQIVDHLKPDPVMTQQRCISQIGILNNKISQEDNLLAARLAVSATRDSSAMKVLAVITAVFLPATYIATLFSMSMFNWQAGSNSPTIVASNATATSDTSSSSGVVMHYIWIYWVVSAILTILVIVGWRLWWVIQDREFRRDLPRGVKSEGAHTPIYRRNSLPTSFLADIIGFNLPRGKDNKGKALV